jgi:hypothetical protein
MGSFPKRSSSDARMSLRSSGLPFSASVGFLNSKAAEGLSPRALQENEHRLRYLIVYAGEVGVGKITSQIIHRHPAWLETEYRPG